MQNIQTVAEDIVYVGASDRRLAKFENLFPIPRGVAYNSYVILDEKTALMDTVDTSVSAQYLENIAAALNGRPLDYLVIAHMEPDHCSTIEAVLMRWPTVRLVCNDKSANIMKEYYFHDDTSAVDAALRMGEGDTLSLGKHTLTFLMAPMVHWPEVMMSYDSATGVLFSADAFGSFGALGGSIFEDQLDFQGEWLPDARRYYANIVGKYGGPVQKVLKKAAALDIRTIAPLHGPIWRRPEDIAWLLGKYELWSSYTPEEKAVVVLYGSMYGNTESAVQAVASKIAAQDVPVAVHDLSVIDQSFAVAECWRASHIVLAAPTYNGGLFLPMEFFLTDCQALTLQNRTFALIENGSWAPASGKWMAAKIDKLKNCQVLDERLTIHGALSDADLPAVEAFADAVVESMK